MPPLPDPHAPDAPDPGQDQDRDPDRDPVRDRSTARRRITAVAAGLCFTAATPPMGWWPLAFVGVVALHRAIDSATGRGRFTTAWLAWFALFLPTLFWMRAMTAPGYVIASIAYAGFLAAGSALWSRGPGRYVAIVGGVVLAEWVRWRWPFGGVPLSNLAIGQVAGPLAPQLRVGGALFVVGTTVATGSALAALLGGSRRIAAGLAGAVVVAAVLAGVAPSGRGTGELLDVALVQGGGPQGTRAATTEEGIVFERHVAATDALDAPVDLLLWPEDVVDVVTLTGSEEDEVMRAIARDRATTFLAGVIEDEGDDRFHNWAVAYGPDGEEIGRYEKVERVPFGEWVPMRSLLEAVAGDALPARDAAIGTTPAVIETAEGTLGVSISWEIFFGERARDAASHGAEVLINPTNGSSFLGTQVQTQQVASSRMRAIETGRWVAQIAPTGFSAVISPSGQVLQRTAVSERAILTATLERRVGTTWYTSVGDLPALLGAAAALGAGFALDRRGRSALRPRSGG